MYALFNELNSDDEYDIICRLRKRGSHIPRRECEPKFITRARQRNSVMAMRMMRDSLDSASGFAGAVGDFSATNGSPMFEAGLDMILTEDEIADGEVTKIEAMQIDMLRIATENPEYLEALMRVGKLKQVLSEERMKKFGVP